jgi:predicted nucleic acid-binding protein
VSVEEIFMEAGRLKASYKISLADSILLAESIISGGTLLTADHHEFDDHGEIKFLWIG